MSTNPGKSRVLGDQCDVLRAQSSGSRFLRPFVFFDVLVREDRLTSKDRCNKVVFQTSGVLFSWRTSHHHHYSPLPSHHPPKLLTSHHRNKNKSNPTRRQTITAEIPNLETTHHTLIPMPSTNSHSRRSNTIIPN